MPLARIRAKRGTGAQWIAANPVLGSGEFAYESDTNMLKLGDAVNHYVDLPYVAGGGGGGGSVTQVNGVNPDGSGHVTLTAASVGAVPTSRTVGGLPLSSNITLTKTMVGLDQADNTSDVDKPVSSAMESALGTKSDEGHTHDDRYPQLSQTNQFLIWRTGDPDPWWVATTRPAGLVMFIMLNTGDTAPSWKTSNDFVFVTDAAASVPTIRAFGGFTALTSDAGNINCTYPAGMQDGDTCWLGVATTGGTTPTTPSGWTVALTFQSSGASGSDGLIVYGRTLSAGQGASLSGTTQNVVLGTTTSGVSTIVCWNGGVSIDVSAGHVDDANTNASQTFGPVTPTAPSTVVGVSAIRYNTLSGGTNVGPRTGWTELFDISTAKAGAPQRGLLFSVLNTEGAAGTPTASATGTTPGPVVRTSEYTVSVVAA